MKRQVSARDAKVGEREPLVPSFDALVQRWMGGA
jgi:hypothetical protein